MKPISWDAEQHDQIRLAIKRLELSAPVWQGDGAIGWTTWGRMHRAPGRWANDGHSLKSQIARRRSSCSELRWKF